MNEVFILEDFLYCVWIYNNYNFSLWDSVTGVTYPSIGHKVLLMDKQKIIIKYED